MRENLENVLHTRPFWLDLRIINSAPARRRLIRYGLVGLIALFVALSAALVIERSIARYVLERRVECVGVRFGA